MFCKWTIASVVHNPGNCRLLRGTSWYSWREAKTGPSNVYVPGWLLRIVPAGFVGFSKDLALNITEMGRH